MNEPIPSTAQALQQPVSPENTAPAENIGEETAQRYRYQWGYCAIVCAGLVTANSEMEAVLCEHHEDFLIKYKAGTFKAVQVATREVGRDAFRTSDDKVIQSFKRFLRLETTFGDSIAGYVLATNCGFWHDDKTGDNLFYTLNVVKTEGPDCLRRRLLRPLLDALRTVDGCTDEIIVKALSKIDLQDGLPQLDDITLRLMKHVAALDGCADLCYHEVLRRSNGLVDIVARASSRAERATEEDYAATDSNELKRADDLHRRAKTITAEAVRAAVEAGTRTVAWLSLPRQLVPLQPDAPHAKLEIKMDAGGISALSIQNQKDLGESAVAFGLQTVARLGGTRGEAAWDHLCGVVRNACQEAFDEAETEDGPFGRQMLERVRLRLRTRWEARADDLCGCQYEHLLGIASELTEQCVVWWSQPFDIGG